MSAELAAAVAGVALNDHAKLVNEATEKKVLAVFAAKWDTSARQSRALA